MSAPQGTGPVATAAAFAAALGQYGALPGGLPMLGWASQVNAPLVVSVAHHCIKCQIGVMHHCASGTLCQWQP